MKLRYPLALIGGLLLGQRASGQTATTDTSLVASAVRRLEQQYAKAFPNHPQLINGPEYVDYARRYSSITGHQFFLAPERLNGSVFYNGQLFPDAHLSYDLVRNQVLLQQPGNPLTLRLVEEHLDYFTIAEHRFIKVTADSASKDLIRAGYYEVLVDSRTQLLARRSKRMQEHLAQGKVTAEFISTDRLFLRKDGAYYAAGKKRSVTRLFADHGKEVQRYIQNNKLQFNKKSREAALVQLTRYYNTLTPQ